MIQKTAELFLVEDVLSVEDAFKREPSYGRLTRFLAGEGPRAIFVFAQPLLEPDAPPDPSGGPIRLFITDGLGVKLNGSAIYFMRRLSPTGRAMDIDLTKSHDAAISYGILGPSLLKTLDAQLSGLFRPVFEQRLNWGKASPEQTHNFMSSLDKFVDALQESLKTLHTGLELRRPDDRFDLESVTTTSSHSSEMVEHFVELLEEWCYHVELYLDESDQSRWESPDAGPDTELEYWRRRLQRLTSITEQLKTKACKSVILVLSSVAKTRGAPGVDAAHVHNLMRRWRQIDVNITEAANEAKDNVKFLSTLEKFIEPLYEGDPDAIIDTLPALLNSIKMIHTIARYYNTTERMTNLFMKITNQMITNCKQTITGVGKADKGRGRGGAGGPAGSGGGDKGGGKKERDSPELLWEKPLGELLKNLEAALRLNEAYQDQYRITKDKLLAVPKGKQFDFSEAQIFGKFDLFCRRVIKLLDMFSTIRQFRKLAEHNLEGMEDLTKAFFEITDAFRAKRHDLLDYNNNKFDRDYVEFNVRISDLETSVQHFVNNSFESITSIEQSLTLLKKFQMILQRDNLKTDLDSKFTVIFHSYGLDLLSVQDLYEKHKHHPPAPRNMPPVAGNIMWARHLLHRVQSPMKRFQTNAKVLALRDSKKIIKTYNKVAKTLVAFEYLWYEAWCNSIEGSKAGLHATLIIRHPHNKQLYVNFDKEILQLIREAKCLTRIGVDVPEGARMVMLQEGKFKDYFDRLLHALGEHKRITEQIHMVTADILVPHLEDLELRLKPGMTTLTWTSMNIDTYLHHVHVGLSRFEALVTNVNDIIENRVEKNLRIISKLKLVALPKDESFSLDEFVTLEEKYVKEQAEQLGAKNTEVERAVDDLCEMVRSYPLAADAGEVDESKLKGVKDYFEKQMYNSVLRSVKNSLNAIRDRVCSRSVMGFLFLERPFFEVDVQLSVPSVRLSPSLEDIQRTLNKTALHVLRVTKTLWFWNQLGTPEGTEKRAFFDRIGCDIEIVKVVLLLTGAFQGTKNQVADYLDKFHVYDWLWKDDMEAAYRSFMEKDPTIDDFDRELAKFVEVEHEIEVIAPVNNIGALSLNTSNLKLQLRNECRQWKVQYSDRVHQQAKGLMEELHEYMRTTTVRLGREVDSLDALRFVMQTLKEVRERESSIEMEIVPILDMYNMLEVYLPGGYMDKEEMDSKAVLRTRWTKMMNFAEEVNDRLSDIQGTFKKRLVADVRAFLEDVGEFRRRFEKYGPTVAGISPSEAVDRLRRFQDEYKSRERKFETYSAGEELFALRRTQYPELTKTKRELDLLEKLYTLYLEVVKVLEQYRSMTWTSAVEQLPLMVDRISSFDLRCKKLPKKLKEWSAYHELRQNITAFQEALPLLQDLSRDCMKQRHWSQIMEITGVAFQLEGDLFKLRTLLDANLLEHKEEVEDVCDASEKQAGIEAKLIDLNHHWNLVEFEFGRWRNRDVPILKAYGGIVEDLEESQLALQTMLSMRHVTPFREETQLKLTTLSDTSDFLELWAKVQMLWMSLESVFTGGDIAKQMPLEAKKFLKIDKDWAKLMFKAEETKNVVQCCGNELLRNTLPILFSELEKCQKSLEGYLEQKRGKFPRFYFVSNPVLLQILSQGSDPLAVQPYYEKVFDSIDRVTHDSDDVKSILRFSTIVKGETEDLAFVTPVIAQGNIEDWLGSMELVMQMTVKAQCDAVAADCGEVGLKQLVDTHSAQMSLLGLQLAWTTDCQTALERAKFSKSVISDTNKKQLSILAELSSWCLEDLPGKMYRIKVETLVTIQVHQRDVFADLAKAYKERRLQDANDFEWLKQARVTWNNDAEDKHGEGACVISICDVDFPYGYEYLGCKERLVITPLTDRAYITLSQALGMHLGGAPAGPAGTGKTETVKDLGRQLGLYVVVTNCTDQQRYTDMAKIFKGLCQAGLWGCFDEFNRIELPVLSVVAQQVLAITNAKRAKSDKFAFPGDPSDIRLNPTVGYFITMNPGYQGRQELPENLKALFRGVAMMVPDREIIMRVKLCSVGYSGFTDLAKKFRTLYKLCEEQLSKQKHYDFGLRNILSVLRTAGKTKRDNPDAEEDMLLMRTLRDMNLSKLVAQDTPLFLSLLKDLFPTVGNPEGREFPELTAAHNEVLVKERLVAHPQWVNKVKQLYETTLVRHGIMLVGPAGTGKTRIMTTLLKALAKTTGIAHKTTRMNPKAIRAEEMFGETDKVSGEWVVGVFGAMWDKFNKRDLAYNTWMCCDGPVDSIWIENLNTVLDDNRILTLANGDRLPMTDNVKILFEVEDLRNASPATVSRAGIIFVSDSDLDWMPIVDAWCLGIPNLQAGVLRGFFDKYVMGDDKGTALQPEPIGSLFTFINRHCSKVIETPRVALVSGILDLLTSFLKSMQLDNEEEDGIEAVDITPELERVFTFALVWGVGGLLELEDRGRFDTWLRELGAPLPTPAGKTDTVFEWYIDDATLEWKPWAVEEFDFPEAGQMPPDHMGPGGAVGAFDTSSLLVPTLDSHRAVFILSALHRYRKPLLLVGDDGTAKTSTALMFFKEISNDSMLVKKTNFSSATTAGMFQQTIEGEIDRRGGKNFGPPGGRQLTVFLDDVSMPDPNEWGDQPTLELVRQLVETAGFAFLDKDKRGELKTIEDLQYVAAMKHPQGGNNDVPSRLKRHFFIFNMIVPSTASLDAIFGFLMRGRFDKELVSREIARDADKLVDATVRLWAWAKKTLLPTPAKFHYIFNLRDLSRVFQGIMRVPMDKITNSKSLVQLWRHECDRVFRDKLATPEDKDKYAKALKENLDKTFGKKASKEYKKAPEVFYVDFMHMRDEDDDGVLLDPPPKVYEPVGVLDTLREPVMEELNRHNEEIPALAMNLVLFDDALEHLLRISRLLGMPRGNALLVGVGGSGKQSLSRLASFMAGYETFQIKLTKQYNTNALMDDLRALFKTTGQVGKGVSFVFTDAHIKDEEFLEYINSILMTGEVPGLFPKDELAIMCAELLPFALKEDPSFEESPANLNRYFIERVRRNLHLILCMSPVNAKFAERARKFPGIINGCTIDWFLPWPEEALVSVSKGLVGDFEMECEASVKTSLLTHMGVVHQLVVSTCSDYMATMRRYVYQTPKSFLSFLDAYKAMYTERLQEIQMKEERVSLGLDKLTQGAKDVEAMKVVLAEEEVKLHEADAACTAMLGSLEQSSLEAKRESDSVATIKDACEADAARIATEKAAAEADLAKAQPYLDEANSAIDSINAGDLTELKTLSKPSDIIKLVFDCVLLLKMCPVMMVDVAPITLGIGKSKKTFEFILDSFGLAKKTLLADVGFLKGLLHFSMHEKDNINDETIELLLPYMDLEDFVPSVARNASKAAEGLCTWVRAMSSYQAASKIVKPKLEAVALAEARLEAAEGELRLANEKLNRCKKVLDRLQDKFETQMADKRAIEENATKTRQKMEQATALINGLSGERARWTDDRKAFASTKSKLVGDCALACAFVSYCGPFNQEFRDSMVQAKFANDLVARGIPVSDDIDLTSFLVDIGTIGDWNMEGLPTDPLSIQNGIMVTRSSRYPLLVDPQGQGLKWVLRRETARRQASGLTGQVKPSSLNDPRLKDALEYALQEGEAIVIAGVETDLDPMLDPILEKQIVTRGKSRYISVNDKMCEYTDAFRLYITTRLPNPHFSPELQAKTTVVDFTVTLKGLEEQLLGRVIQKEQHSLEEQLQQVLEEVNANTKALMQLDAQLLERLTANSGNLLDDVELIGVLADTKAKATEVTTKLAAAEETQTNINEKREQFRPVATRGSVLYFAIVDVSLMNHMYQTSLDQFLALFMKSMDIAEKSSLASHRVINILGSMTRLVVNHIGRGLYEKDKLSFKLIVLFKILVAAGRLPPQDVALFLKVGAALDIGNVRTKTLPWLSDAAWLNAIALSEECPFFNSLPDSLTRGEAAWRRWYEDNEPEKLPAVDLEGRLVDGAETGAFYRLLLCRALREDRTIVAATEFIRTVEFVSPAGAKGGHSGGGSADDRAKLPAMGEDFTLPISATLKELFDEMNHITPVIYLLSAGADPTASIEQFARKMKQTVACVSMGEGQDVVAEAAITAASTGGSWVLLQNCHLGLDFMERLDALLKSIASSTSTDFRLFITAEPHPAFPISLLQLCTKVTNEPPAGLRAGLLRSYSVVVDQERLERVDTSSWRQLLFALCFLHSVVQERRKFGPLGWNIPYEFNNSDLVACMTFLEKHMYHGAVSWSTVQFMVSEVQYGGKITDDMDRRLFNTFASNWVSANTVTPAFTFNPAAGIGGDDFVYNIPESTEIEAYRVSVKQFPEFDNPQIFGLHPNADLTFRVKEVTSLLSTISDTMPKQSAVGTGLTREDVVDAKATELLDKLPREYTEDDVGARITAMGGMAVPLNIFLFQEVQRLTAVISNVYQTLTTLQQAIHGEVVMTPALQSALDALFDARVPPRWVTTVGGDEVSWLSPTLGLWFAGLLQRDSQLREWLERGRPVAYWLTGFFNGQGFLTAMRQEVTRAHAKDKWALDDVVFFTEVMEFERVDQVRAPPREGCYLHGLFVEGAAWNKSDATLEESEPKKLYAPLPILYVTAVTKAQQRAKSADHGPYGGYECPVYKYPVRTDRYLIFTVTLATREVRPSHWVLRGVALLCTTD